MVSGLPDADFDGYRTLIIKHEQGTCGRDSTTRRKVAYQYARINAQLGDPDESFRWLETARRIKDPGVMAVRTDPLIDPLRKDPRFGRLMHELGLDALDCGS